MAIGVGHQRIGFLGGGIEARRMLWHRTAANLQHVAKTHQISLDIKGWISIEQRTPACARCEDGCTQANKRSGN